MKSKFHPTKNNIAKNEKNTHYRFVFVPWVEPSCSKQNV